LRELNFFLPRLLPTHLSFTIFLYGESSLKAVGPRAAALRRVEQALRTQMSFRPRRALLAAAVVAGAALSAPHAAFAENFFDFLFGGVKPQARQISPQASFFADPFGTQQSASAPAPRVAGSGPAFCVRSCDGKYFPINARGNATPAQLCQAFCPASATKV